MTQQEHVQWARRRAHAYVDAGEGEAAIASMISDLQKHEGTLAATRMCWVAAMTVRQDDAAAVRRWIDGCIPAVPVEAR